ncbi:MAG: methyltransferase domain-containing protein [Sulfuricaulis sp.]|nr:methyltransferase domain-containing protein [Sulfuricaulis sp.]
MPALFKQWPPVMASAAKIESGNRVLDVACGTGILARELAARVRPKGSVTGLDVTPGMLEVAKSLAPKIDWKHGNAEALPFPDHSFDRVVSQFGMMFFPNRIKSMREMLRVLAPRGRLAVAVWDTLESMPAYADEVELLERTAGTPAANALRAPFVLGNKKNLLKIAQDAGVAFAEVKTHEGTANFPSLRALVESDLRGWLPLVGVHLEEAVIQETLEEAEAELRQYVNPQGRAVFKISAHVLSGSKP